jgi:hypothetical protein
MSTTEMSANKDVLFADDFSDGPDSSWDWLRPKPGHWRSTGSGLDIRVEPGKADTVVNALQRPAPDRTTGTFAIEVTVSNLTPPIEQYEQVGITWYCGGKPVFKLVKELIDGGIFIIPGRCSIPDQSIRLRLIVTANTWEAQYRSTDSGPFLRAEKGELPVADNDQVSLQCYNGPAEAEHWMRFENFRISRLD